MGITTHAGTMPGGMTPICNACGVFLCWDISEHEAEAAREFWDAWVCQECNGGTRMSLQQWLDQFAPAARAIRAAALPRFPSGGASSGAGGLTDCDMHDDESY